MRLEVLVMVNVRITVIWDVSPVRIAPGKETPVPIMYWKGGPQSRSGSFGVEKNSFPLSGI
jgi:hypothetical protein